MAFVNKIVDLKVDKIVDSSISCVFGRLGCNVKRYSRTWHYTFELFSSYLKMFCNVIVGKVWAIAEERIKDYFLEN